MLQNHTLLVVKCHRSDVFSKHRYPSPHGTHGGGKSNLLQIHMAIEMDFMTPTKGVIKGAFGVSIFHI